jgi:predicted phosphodiesterase
VAVTKGGAQPNGEGPLHHPGDDGFERVAVITDIHANLSALEAVLEAIRWLDVDGLYCGGDLVGYGPRPNEVCRLIEERRIPTIYGNYDWAIARDRLECGCAYVTEHDRALGQRSVAWTLARTDRHSKHFMHRLPFDLRFRMGGRRIHEYGGVLFVNCGAVGKPKDGDARAAFALLELNEAGEVHASIERVPYDAEAVARDLAAAGLPSEYAEKLVAAA